MKSSNSIPMALALAALFTSVPAVAEPHRGVVYTGGTISEGVSGYAGAVASLPGAELGNGAMIKAGVASGRYVYNASGTKIVGKYISADVALGYQFSSQWGWANVSAGPHHSETALSPEDPANERRGSRWDLNVQSDGALDGRAWRLGWYGSYGAIDETYQARLQLGRRTGAGDLRIGVEAGVQGDPSYTRRFAGAFASTLIGENLDLLVAAGASDQAGRSARPYGSIAISKLF